MQPSYKDLIDQTFEFPQEGFKIEDNVLYFHDVSLMELIKKYGTPLKISYLPKISTQIQKAKMIFNVAMARSGYKGKYIYCYCTKSSHFSFVLEEALKNEIHVETSSSYDIPIIRNLNERGLLGKDRYILCNGFKPPKYAQAIADLINDGFENVIPILDNKEELNFYDKLVKKKCNLGIRIAAEEEPKFPFYTSRLGIREKEILDFYSTKIKGNPKYALKMLHFFINTGIKDTFYYWTELTKCIDLYCELKLICPELDSLDIGGGFPIKTSLQFEYDYEYMAGEIISKIKQICNDRGVQEPDIFTEFGKFTVGESGATIYSVTDIKRQNDNELWYMIDSSFITTLPDTWGIGQKFILLPVNHWKKPYQRVNLGGLTCDSDDYYSAESHLNQVYLPETGKKQPLYVGFFHTGAYQESLGGYGGIQHCLIPAPKHVIIDKDEDGEIFTRLFAKEQSHKSMLKILGY